LVRSACLFLFCVVASASTLKFAVSNNCLKHGDSVVMNVCVLNVCDSLVCFSEV
jgi:citrate lyase synthetase